MKKSLIIILGLFVISITSCEYKYADINVTVEEAFFAADIQPIFDAKCATCHKTTNPVLTNGKSYNSLIDGGYVNTGDPETSKLYIKVSEGHPGGSGSLSPMEMAQILKWIQDGANND